MLRNYFRIAYRTLLRNKVFSLINISGLAVGMAACFFIFIYVHFESSYDRFNRHAANLFRVPLTFTGSLSNIGAQATDHPAAGPALKREFPEVVDFARVVPASLFIPASTMTYKNLSASDISFNEGKIFLADSSFLTMFSYPFLEGNPQKALTEPNTMVISETEARKYFGQEEPVGKTLYLNNQQPLKITGVFKDVPENSHIKFDMLISMTSFRFANGPIDDNWTWPEFYTYVQLAPGTDRKKMEARFPALINKNLGGLMKQWNYGIELRLQPITDIHLKSDYSKEAESNGNEKEIYFLTVIGIFILLIAWINYINLTTAKSMERAKEVGLRKVVGAEKKQLIGQFMMESAIINLLALVISAIIVFICFPFMNEFIGKNVSQEFLTSGLLTAVSFWLRLTAIFAAGTLLVGCYPAFVLSAFKPALVLKGKFNQSAKGISLRRILVSFQFILSILLIAATILVYRQLSFMRSQALGYNKDQVVVIRAPAVQDSSFAYKIASFRTRLLQNPSVISMAPSSDIPGETISGRNTMRLSSQDETHNFTPFQMEINDQFINTFQMTMAAGRNFRPEDSSDLRNGKTKVIINEVVARALGFKNNEDAVSQFVIFRAGIEERGQIIGVVKNYHQRSLREAYDPILYYFPSHNDWKYISLQVKASHMQQNLASVEDLYKSVFSGSPFEYFFLNAYFDRQYQADQRFGRVFGLFTFLAILVACLGLLGLSSFMIRLRTKEIGVRKVLGASTGSIVYLFSKDFLKLVCVATLICVPIIYYVAGNWLMNYAFHISLGWLIFVMPPLLLLMISLITTSIQSTRAALDNPMRSLKESSQYPNRTTY